MLPKSLKSGLIFTFLLFTAAYFPTGPALADSIDFTDSMFSDCDNQTSCEKTLGGVKIRIEGWNDADPKDGVLDPQTDSPAPLFWQPQDGNGYHDGFGVRTGEQDEIESPEFLVVRFLNNDDPGEPGNWHYVKHTLSEINVTNLFNENGYLERGAYQFTVNEVAEDWIPFEADSSQVSGTTNGVLDLPVPTPPYSEEIADYITFTAPEPGYIIPSGQNHEFSLAGLNAQAIYNLSISRVGTGSGTITSDPSGINCGSECTKYYDSETEVTLTATSDLGSTFSGWSGDCDETGHVTVDGDKGCTATFTLETVTLTITTTGSGTGTTSGGGTYDYGDTATVSATANSGSTFAGWSGPDGTECGTGSVLMNGNKSCTATFDVVANKPDLVMTDVTPHSATANQGGTLSVTNTAKNQGPVSSGLFRVGFLLSTDSIYGNGDDVAITTIRTVFSLGPGDSNTATTNLYIPSTTPGGTYHVCATADKLGQVDESDESNNALCSPGTITLPKADLVMTAVSTTTTAVLPGQPLSVTNSVKNQGGFKAGTFRIGFYLSLNSDGSTQDKAITNYRAVSSLAAGATNTASTTVTIPYTTFSGSYFICAVADSLYQVDESSETNNVGCTTISTLVQGDPDLIMTQVEPNASSVSAGGTLSEMDTVKNIGTGPARPFSIAYSLSVDTTYGNGDDLALLPPRTIGNSQNDPALLEGDSNSATTVLNIPAATPPGTYHLCAVADWNNLVYESSESNNSLCSSATIAIVPIPDLIVTALSTTASAANPGGTIPVSISLTNQGGVTAGTSVVAFHFSPNATYGDSDDIPSVTTWTSGSLYQGTTVSITTQINIPATTPQGPYHICVMADSTGAVTEGDESNNTSCTSTTVTIGTP